MRRSFPLLMAFLALLVISACAGKTNTPPSGDAVLVFPRSGLYRLELRGAGEPSITTGRVPVPLLKRGKSVFFYVAVRRTRYSHVSTAFLRWEEADSGARMADRAAGGRESRLPQHDFQTQAWTPRWVEHDRKYLPTARLPEPWLDAAIYPHAPVTESVVITDAVLASPVTVTVRLWSHSSTPQNPDHHMVIGWNGRKALDERWDDDGVYTFTFPAKLLPGENRISLKEPGDTGAPVEVAYLDAWSVTYRRKLDFRAGPMRWQAEADAVEADAPDGRTVWLLDMTDPVSPTLAGEAEATGGSVTFATIPGHEYWAGFPDAASEPRRLPMARADQGALAQADYVVVADSSFRDALKPLVRRHSESGLKVAMVTPWAVYDTWGDGTPDPKALRRFLAWKAESGKPARFLLLVGDADLKPWNGTVGTEIPVTFVRTRPLGETPSDLATVWQGDFPMPALGRVPADSPEEVEAWVKKTLAWDEAPSRDLVISDEKPEFSRFADDIAHHLAGEGREVTRVSLAGPDVRKRVLDAAKSGPLWLHYVGHGSLTMWGKSHVLTSDDAEKWDTPNAAATWTCLDGYFVHPRVRSVAERWLFSPKGGVTFFVAPTGEGFTSDQESLAMAFYDALTREPTVGEALRVALRQRENPVTMQYILFGDPATPCGNQ